MGRLFLSVVCSVFLSTAVVAADGSSSAPVAEGAIPSGYVWLSGGAIAIGIGFWCSWGDI